jgi:hypothetical protein
MIWLHAGRHQSTTSMTFDGVRRAYADRKIARRLAPALLGLLTAAMVCWSCTAAASENSEIAHRRAAERKTFTDAEIADGFFKVTFGAEFHVAGGVDRIRKFDGPVRVFIDNRATPDRTPQLEAAIADIRSRIRNLDIARTERREEANMIVSLINDRDLARMIRTVYGIDRARRIQRSLEPQCLSGFRKDENSRILRSDVIITADVGEFVFYDCVYEELLQALGPINDDTTVPWTMFNDDVQMGYFGMYDQYLLNILYDTRIRPGMTRAEVQALLPVVLPEARAFVEENNKGP